MIKLLYAQKNPIVTLMEKYNNNPLFNLILYDVELPDGEIKEYSANVISENIYAQVNVDGHVKNTM